MPLAFDMCGSTRYTLRREKGSVSYRVRETNISNRTQVIYIDFAKQKYRQNLSGVLQLFCNTPFIRAYESVRIHCCLVGASVLDGPRVDVGIDPYTVPPPTCHVFASVSESKDLCGGGRRLCGIFQVVLSVDYFPAGGVTFLFRQESNQRNRLRGGAEVVPFRLDRFRCLSLRYKTALP